MRSVYFRFPIERNNTVWQEPDFCEADTQEFVRFIFQAQPNRVVPVVRVLNSASGNSWMTHYFTLWDALKDWYDNFEGGSFERGVFAWLLAFVDSGVLEPSDYLQILIRLDNEGHTFTMVPIDDQGE